MVSRNQGFTEKDITDFWESFKLVDEDNNGEISYKELGTILQKLGQNPSVEQLKDMISSVDKNGNGEIDFCEFIDLMSDIMKDTDL